MSVRKDSGPNELVFDPKLDFFTHKQGVPREEKKLYHLNPGKLNSLNSRNTCVLLMIPFTRPASPVVDTR